MVRLALEIAPAAPRPVMISQRMVKSYSGKLATSSKVDLSDKADLAPVVAFSIHVDCVANRECGRSVWVGDVGVVCFGGGWRKQDMILNA